MYITYKGKNSSVGHIKKQMGKVVLKDVIDVLQGKKSSNPNVVKIITEEMYIDWRDACVWELLSGFDSRMVFFWTL